MTPARILVVDDYEPALAAIVDVLALAGYAPDGVGSSIAAREAIWTERYDLIVSDYEMSGGSGLDLLTLARRVAPDTPVILYSGSPAARYLKGALERGAFAYLEKPFPMALLLERVRDALRLGEP